MARTVPKYVFYDVPKPDVQPPRVLSVNLNDPGDLEGLQQRDDLEQTAYLVGRVSDPFGHAGRP